MLGTTHSDLAFTGKYAIQGNYNGFEIYDISNPAKPVLVNTYLCPASQNDVSVYKNLLFMSSEATNSRADCGFGGVPDPVSKERVRGIRIFDIADVEESEARDERADLPRLAHAHRRRRSRATRTTSTSTCRARPACARPKKCRDAWIRRDGRRSEHARFRLEVIKVPLAAPQTAAIFERGAHLPEPAGRGRRNPERDGAGRAAGAGAAGQPPAAGAARRRAAAARWSPAAVRRRRGAAARRGGCRRLALRGAAGARRGGGRGGGRGSAGPPTGPEPVPRHHGVSGRRPRRRRVRRPRPAARHPRSDAPDPHRLRRRPEHVVLALGDVQQRRQEGALHRRVGRRIARRAAATPTSSSGAPTRSSPSRTTRWCSRATTRCRRAQTDQENCVAHNGSLIPIPGRDVMVQALVPGRHLGVRLDRSGEAVRSRVLRSRPARRRRG